MKPQKGAKSTKRIIRVLVGLLVMCVCGVTACRRSANEKRFDLKGKVIVVEPDKHLVTVSHDDIKGYMPAMTMPFTVPSESDLKILAPDDQITTTRVDEGQ